MTAERTSVFLTDAGAKISVRIPLHAPTTLEPLYASDVELLDGATGELQGTSGESSRGTVRRRGAVFTLEPEQHQEVLLEQTETPSPSGSSRAALRAEFEEPAESTPSQAEAITAAGTVARFLRGEDSVSLTAAKQAQSIVSRFIAERERQMSADE